MAQVEQAVRLVGQAQQPVGVFAVDPCALADSLGFEPQQQPFHPHAAHAIGEGAQAARKAVPSWKPVAYAVGPTPFVSTRVQP